VVVVGIAISLSPPLLPFWGGRLRKIYMKLIFKPDTSHMQCFVPGFCYAAKLFLVEVQNSEL